MLAIVVLVAAALILLITGMTAGSSGSGSSGGQSTPFRLLPLPGNTVTSIVTDTEPPVEESSQSDPEPLSSLSAAFVLLR